MPGVLAALVAFTREHQRYGDLDGGLDEGHVWLACSCGARMEHPASAPPGGPAPA
jgi:hypothetical protein